MALFAQFAQLKQTCGTLANDLREQPQPQPQPPNADLANNPLIERLQAFVMEVEQVSSGFHTTITGRQWFENRSPLTITLEREIYEGETQLEVLEKIVKRLAWALPSTR